ncbi:hypothetical protein [Bradyrhizobium sp. 155]|uniref:hypothetical protein n=1 Tax=Bradyrhizobium sp. 155 TaxID=2782629 RepID=UPI003211DD0E
MVAQAGFIYPVLAEGGDDLRMLPLSMRKTNLERLLARRPEGVFVNPFERGELGPDLFRACLRAKKEAVRCGGLSSSVAVAGP